MLIPFFRALRAAELKPTAPAYPALPEARVAGLGRGVQRAVQ